MVNTSRTGQTSGEDDICVGYKLEEAVSVDYWLHCTYPHMTVIDAAGLARGVFGLQ